MSDCYCPAPHFATASSPLLYCLSPPPLPLQVTTGSDVYSFGVLMWSLYTGQQPYVILTGVPRTNPHFPHFPKAGHAAHPQYTYLAERCLRVDPHERPSFAEIGETLQDFFHSVSLVLGPPQPAPPCLNNKMVLGPAQPPPDTSKPAGSDSLSPFSSSQLSYLDSRHILASSLSSAASSQPHLVAQVHALVGPPPQQQAGAEVQALAGQQQQQQGAEVQALVGQRE